MLNIKVDEGYAYDYLAILRVKYDAGLISNVPLSECGQYLKEQVGEELHEKIIASDFYKECVRVNRLTFEAVDGAKIDTVKASVVHNLNTDRYIAKTRLQREFFPSASVTEKKN